MSVQIKIDNAVKKYGNNVIIPSLNLTIKEGEFFTLLGPSGCGKTTLLRMIAGFNSIEGGDFYFNDTRVNDMDPAKRNIGMVFQNFNLFSNMTVLKNCTVGQEKVLKKSKEEAQKNAMMYLEKVGMAPYINAKPKQLSGGQKQRVAIARALASDPKILLCDEATSALDPQTTSSILELLKKINRQFGITIVIITHQMSVVREICTHVAIMYEGEVVEKGLVADIFANPQSEVAKELIRKDTGSDIDADSRLDAGREKGQAEIKSGEKIRIVFSENSAFEPVIANLILTFGEPVNILKADTKNVGGVAKGEMILEFMEGSTRTEMMKQYLKEKGLAIGEVTEYVGS